MVAFNERNEQMVREYQIAIENMEIQRERLADCVRKGDSKSNDSL